MTKLRAALVTREYPPEVYGGAGVHVENLARELAALVEVQVHCFGQPRTSPLVARSYQPWDAISGDAPHLAALRTMSVDVAMAAHLGDVDIVHSHTWYANHAGTLAQILYGAVHVMTAHSLEPRRPWKAEQLGGGYALSCHLERTAMEAADAVIAVSDGMKRDILESYPVLDAARVHVIRNGVNLSLYRPVPPGDVLREHGLSTEQPYVMFVGRITRQKGIVHLCRAARDIDPSAQLVLCAGAPDTPEIAAEVAALVDELQASRGNVTWIQRMLPAEDIVELLSHARVFVCPSVYEPFGLVNVEAMAAGAPVVATAVGGIPEVVVDGETGLLVHYEGEPTTGEPIDPGELASKLASAVNELIHDADRARSMGQAGRARAVDHFSWSTVAQRTAELYAVTVRGRR